MSADTLQSAIAPIRSGDQGAGKLLLAEVIRDEPGNETAWLWTSSTVDSNQQRRERLEQVLGINPHNETARRGGLEALSQKQVEQPPQPQTQPHPPPQLLPMHCRQSANLIHLIQKNAHICDDAVRCVPEQAARAKTGCLPRMWDSANPAQPPPGKPATAIKKGGFSLEEISNGCD